MLPFLHTVNHCTARGPTLGDIRSMGQFVEKKRVVFETITHSSRILSNPKLKRLPPLNNFFEIKLLSWTTAPPILEFISRQHHVSWKYSFILWSTKNLSFQHCLGYLAIPLIL